MIETRLQISKLNRCPMSRPNLAKLKNGVANLVVLAFCWFAGCNTLWGQAANNKYLSVSPVWGQIGVHSSELKYLNNTNPTGIQIDMGIHYLSQKTYSEYSFYPRAGVTLNYWDFQDESIGKGASATAYLEPFLMSFDHFMMSVKGGIGLMWLSNPYDSITNKQNKAYSLSWAIPVNLGASLYFPLNDKWLVKAEGMLRYFSNGGVKQPNEGLFYTTASLGVEYAFNRYYIPPRQFSQGWHVAPQLREKMGCIFVSAGFKEDKNQQLRLLPGIQLQHLSQWTRINGWSGSARIEYDSVDEGDVLGSALIGHHFYLSKVLLMQELGVYLFGAINTQSSVFQQYTIRYHNDSNWLAGFMLKADGLNAEYIGFQLGYIFARKNAR